MTNRQSILLMDEDAETLEQLQTVLQREGFQVFVAADGQAALRLAKAVRPNLIVSDLLLAGLDGYEVWRALHLDRDLPKIPILVISALTIPPNNEAWRPTPDAEWQILHYDAALPKPVDLRRFVRVVERLLAPAERQSTIPDGPSAILVSENRAIQAELTTLLGENDFGVKVPESLEEAFQWMRSIPPAALIVDYHQPGEATKSLLFQANTFAPNTVIVLIVEPTQTIEADLEACCHGYLTLPLHATYTLNSLNYILELHNMRRRTQALSSSLITINRNLLNDQQALQAQNDELQLVNTKLKGLDTPKETFAGIMVHDLKSPLGSILGTLNFLITDPDLNLSPMSENLLNGSIAAGNQMLRLVETLLEGQRFESGNFKVYREPFDLATIIEIILEQITPFMTLHNLAIVRNISANLPLAFADANVIQRVIENLLDNAIKYSPGSTTITISAVVEDHFLKVTVADEGPGIPDEEKSYVFDRFMLLKKTNQSPTRSGFGLALNYCNLAIQALGGSIWVESEGPVGTSFIFTIPTFTG